MNTDGQIASLFELEQYKAVVVAFMQRSGFNMYATRNAVGARVKKIAIQ